MQWLDAPYLARQIQLLDPSRFVDLGNDFLVEKAVAAGIDGSCIATNLHIADPDGGIDARCVNAPHQAGRLIHR